MASHGVQAMAQRLALLLLVLLIAGGPHAAWARKPSAEMRNSSNTSSTLYIRGGASTSIKTSLSRRALASTSTGQTYHGGPVMTNPVKVYMVYIGYQPDDPEPTALNYLVKNLGSTAWWKVMTKYYRVDPKTKAKVFISGKITLAKAVYLSVKGAVDNFQGDLKGDTAIPDLLANLNGVEGISMSYSLKDELYVLVPKKDKRLAFPKEFCDSMCAWHNFQEFDDGSRMIYAFVPQQEGCASCTGDIAKAVGDPSYSPTGSTNIDAMVDSLVHELAEAVTDPDVSTGWFDDSLADKNENENGDVCASKYGSLKTLTYDDGSEVKHNQLVGPDENPYVWQLIWRPDVNPKTKKQYGCVNGV